MRIHRQVPGGIDVNQSERRSDYHLWVRTLVTRRHVYTVLSDTTLVVPFALPSYHLDSRFPLTKSLQVAQPFRD